MNSANRSKIKKRDFASLILRSCLYSLLSTVFYAQADCIGVVTTGGGVDFWQHVEKGALQAGKDHKIQVYVRGPKDETDIQSQFLIVEQMVKLDCKALVIAPNAAERIDQVAAFVQQNIPVIFIDRNFSNADFAIVQTDNYLAGKLAGQHMVQQLNKGAKVAILRYAKNVTSTNQRVQGFIAEINASQLDVVIDEYIGTDLTDASLKVYALLSAHPEIEGLFTPNESTTLATINARKRIPEGSTHVHIGFDSHPELLNNIKSNHLAGLIIQSPYQIGYQGVKMAIKALKNEEIPASSYTPAFLVTKETIDSPVIEEIISGY